MDGFLLIDKPKNITSFGVCNKIKKKFNIDKVGHNGTLDPNTTGLMILALGKATKLLKLINEHDKEYIAKITFGYDSKTLDFESELTEVKTNVNLDKIKEGLEYFKNQDEQIPPMTSSIKINGKKLMDYQKNNIDVDVKPRKVKLYNYEILSDLELVDGHYEIDVKLNVSKGYYVRALARDLGKYLGGSAILHELRRTKMNDYDVINAKMIDDVSENDIINITDFFDLPKVTVEDYMVKLVKNGIELDERQTNLSGIFYVVNNCDIIAIYEEVSHLKYKPILIFK